MGDVSLERFRQEARTWLASLWRRRELPDWRRWGDGSDDVGVFHGMAPQQEDERIEELRAWRRVRFDAGYGAISWEEEFGGRNLPPAYELAYLEEESSFATPASHEAVGITTDLIAPTIRAWGTLEQRERFLRPMLRTDVMWCQLFSEPDAGSDLAGVRTTATSAGDGWIVNGQKVWTSGARHAEWGYLLARSDPSASRHRGLTAFLVPMDAAGVVVRPIRQMTGGSSFNEVFFTDVLIPDECRLGPVGEGWRVAMTTLGFERVAGSGEGNELLRRFHLLVGLAGHLGRRGDRVVCQLLADVYVRARLTELNAERVRRRLSVGQTPGPEGSVAKLFFDQGLDRVSEVASLLLGPALTADTGRWGHFAWAQHVVGAPGAHIAGGTDEIQRTIIAERVLGLPAEPRTS